MSDLIGRVALRSQPSIWMRAASADGFHRVAAKVPLRDCYAGGIEAVLCSPGERANSFLAVSVEPGSA